MINFSGLFRLIALFCLLVYVIIGLGMSGLEEISKIGAAAAIVGFFSIALAANKVPDFIKKYCFVISLLAVSWLWAKDGIFSDLTNYLVPALGGVLFAALIAEQVIGPRIAVLILSIPFFINGYAYLIGDNLTAELYDLDYDAAFLRFGGYVGHPSPLVTRLLVPLVVFGVLKDYMPRGVLKNTAFLLGLLSAIFAIYVTGSKKSILIALPFFFIALFFAREEFKSWGQNSKIFGGFVFLALFFTGITIFGGSIFDSITDVEVVRRIGDSLNNDDSTYDRSRLLLLGLDLIVGSPLWGYGLNQFATVTGVGYYSHNNFIELMVSAGLVGLLAYVFVVYGVVISFFKNKKFILGCSILYLFLALDFTGVSYSDRGSQIIVCAALLSAAAAKIKRNEQKSFAAH